MTYQTVGYTLVVVLFFAIRYFNRTDTSKIQYLPELPGVPIFGNLIQLGDNHSLNAGKWAKKLGSVFQVRLGNRVCQIARKCVQTDSIVTRELYSQIRSKASENSGFTTNRH